MKINYANAKVKKAFSDLEKMKKKLSAEWVRTIKKHLNNMEAAENFGIFLSLGLGHPEQLTGYSTPTFSIRITPNVRMIIEVKAEQSEIMNCNEVEVKGVCDYHGDKENWYIP